MRVLILGGTRFIGWHIVAACLKRGHCVTLLNRGLSDPGQWPGLQLLVADRSSPVPETLFGNREWDLVIDCCAYAPADLAVVRHLQKRTGHYTLISSCSVHIPGLAPAKRACEQAAAELMSGTPLLIPRLGLTIGHRDPTGRLAYWLKRALAGGEHNVPIHPAQPLRLIDVRDVASYVLASAQAGLTGRPDVLGTRTTAGDLFALVSQVTGGAVRWRWIPEADALAEGLQPWTQIPLWLPPGDAVARELMTRNPVARLRLRPLKQTLADCVAWHSNSRGHPATPGM